MEIENVRKAGEYAEPTEEQKQYKATKDTFRREIPFLVDLQKRAKDNRRVTTKDDRVYDQSTAQSAVANNSYSLRHHYLAYGFFRGRDIGQIETPNQKLAGTKGYTSGGFKDYDREAIKQITEKMSEGGRQDQKTVRYNS